MSAPRPSPVTESDLVAFADGRLDPTRVDAVDAWLEANQVDRERVTRWRRQTGLLRAALDPVGAEAVPPQLTAVLEAKPRRGLRALLPMAATIVGVTFGVAAGWIAWGAQAPLAAQEMAEIGLSAHQVYIQEMRHPVEVTVDDKQHLLTWLTNRVGTPIVPPDLSADGLTLLGGRVVPENGWPAALLMYEDTTGERFTLLIVRYREPETSAFRYVEEREAGAYYWMDGRVGYVFSGPNDRELLRGLAEQVYDQLS